MRFETLDQAQAYLDRWDAHWADTRIHGTTKRQVAAMFAEEQPILQPLPHIGPTAPAPMKWIASSIAAWLSLMGPDGLTK